ncbi:hypothetical protein [Nonomuraea sp. NPDC048916]|uniref:hypothetical protein n=1 Tax=Nonomuraea sp. NPDC048916 TaxID=3154232 RepID=UPI0033F849C5
MAVVFWVLLGIAVALWIAASATTTGRPVWPFAPCLRCEGKGRWKMADRSSFSKGRHKHVYCSVCRSMGVQVRLCWR